MTEQTGHMLKFDVSFFRTYDVPDCECTVRTRCDECSAVYKERGGELAGVQMLEQSEQTLRLRIVEAY